MVQKLQNLYIQLLIELYNETDNTCFLDELINISHNKNIEVRQLDLSSMSSVRLFAKSLHETEDKIDVLINNAGAAGLADKRTKDGLQILMAINHFGPFLLTNLLLGTVYIHMLLSD